LNTIRFIAISRGAAACTEQTTLERWHANDHGTFLHRKGNRKLARR
jgi:hypothetical protein